MAKSKDPIRLAKDMFDEFLTKADPHSVSAPKLKVKDPEKQASGRSGGLKGGPARAAKLSAKKRSTIARKAAKSRWPKS